MATLLRTPLGLRILTHTPGRLVVSLAGILLAVVLMFSQAGYSNGMFDSQTELIHRFNGDLFIIGRLKYLMFASEPFASRRLSQARSCAGVRGVYPVYCEDYISVWKNPEDGTTRPIRVLACNLDDPVFDFQEVHALADALRLPDTVLFDAKSRDYYGRPGPGTVTELSGHRVTVVGTFRLGTDFLVDGNLIMNDRNFLKIFPDRTSPSPSLNKVEFGVIQLDREANPGATRQALRDVLPDDVNILSKSELIDLESKYWRDNSVIGFIFSLGVVVGFVIGVLICYQILYSNVSNYLPQFATLKAMGYPDRFLVGVVLQQGFFLAVLGFVPAVGAAQVLFWVVGRLTGLLLFLTFWRIVFILVLTVAMCMVSGIIAVRRVLTTDPAEVFR